MLNQKKSNCLNLLHPKVEEQIICLIINFPLWAAIINDSRNCAISQEQPFITPEVSEKHQRFRASQVLLVQESKCLPEALIMEHLRAERLLIIYAAYHPHGSSVPEDGNKCSILSNDDKRVFLFLKFFSECHFKFLQPYQDVASGLGHGEFFPLKHCFGKSMPFEIRDSFVFSSKMDRCNKECFYIQRSNWCFSVHSGFHFFKRNHSQLQCGESDHIVYYQNLDPFTYSRTTCINWDSTGKIKSPSTWKKANLVLEHSSSMD